MTPEWQAKVSAWLLAAGCLYMMAWGSACSSWDDCVDLANLNAFAYREIPAGRFVMTTWHDEEALDEVFWYSKNNAIHPAVEMQQTVLLHISKQSRGEEFLFRYAQA